MTEPLRRALVTLLGATLVAAPLPATGAPAAMAAEAPAPGSLSSPTGGLVTTEIAVPEGAQAPFGLRATLRGPRSAPGDLVVLVEGRETLRSPSTRRREVELAVRPGDAADGSVEVGLRHDPPDGDACVTTPVAASLDDLVLDFGGAEQAPTAAEEFFPATTPRVDVVVPTGAAADLLGAALAAVASLARAYPDADVGLRAEDDAVPVVGAGQRVVELRDGDGDGEAEVGSRDGVPSLLVSGPPEALPDAVAMLVPPPQDGPVAVGTRQPLARLTTEEMSLGGYGTSAVEVPVPQDVFGSPVSEVAVHLEGTHTPLEPGVVARLEVVVGDTVVGSQDLGGGRRVVVDAVVPTAALEPVLDVRVELTATPADGDCSVPAPGPLRLELDANDSTLEGRPDLAAAAGLGALPAALEGRLAVALGADETGQVDDARRAAPVVAALQRAAARPLAVDLVDPATLLEGRPDASGLVIGADEREVARLDALVPLDRDGDPTAEEDDGAPYAVLQAVPRAGRTLLLLGAWAPDGTDPGSLLDRTAYAVGQSGWGDLTGDAVVVRRGAGPVGLDAPPREPATRALAAEQAADDGGDTYLWWFAAGLAVLLLLLAAQGLVGARRQRRRPTVVTAAAAPPPVPPRPAPRTRPSSGGVDRRRAHRSPGRRPRRVAGR